MSLSQEKRIVVGVEWQGKGYVVRAILYIPAHEAMRRNLADTYMDYCINSSLHDMVNQYKPFAGKTINL